LYEQKRDHIGQVWNCPNCLNPLKQEVKEQLENARRTNLRREEED
jgi:Zn-finger protein